MIRTVQGLADALEATTVGGADHASLAASAGRLVIDSRLIEPGDVFVAVRADRDGHGFVVAARMAGASWVIAEHVVDEGATLLVEDTFAALARAGRVARSELTGPVVGITGSVGKTTTKDLVAAVLGQSKVVNASPRSLNNELGVPLTLLGAPDGTQVSVIEMGARGGGHIAELCRIASPTIGLVTLVAPAHLELFGTVDAIVDAKGELIESLPADGIAVLNADQLEVSAMASRSSARVLTFGMTGDVRPRDVVLDDELRVGMHLDTPWGPIEARLGVRGRHQVMNAAAATAAALAAGASVGDVAAGLEVTELSPWRMEVSRAESGALIVNDAYNANPESMAAALRSLADLDASRRVAILGEMAELGDTSASAHSEMASLAASLGIEVVAVGTELYSIEPVAAADVISRLGALDSSVAVLVKGSRVAALEGVAARLLQ